MEYKIYFTDVKLPSGQSQPDFKTLIPFKYDEKEIAIDQACKMMEMNRNVIVWKITGPNNFLMNRKDVERVYYWRTGKRART